MQLRPFGSSKSKPYVPVNILTFISNTLIQPYFDYCFLLWVVCNKTLKDVLLKLQNRAAGVIARGSYEIRSADVLRSLGWENLETRRFLSKATFLNKVLSNTAAPALKDTFISRNTSLNNDFNPRNWFGPSKTKFSPLIFPFNFPPNSVCEQAACLWNNFPPEAKHVELIFSYKNF